MENANATSTESIPPSTNNEQKSITIQFYRSIQLVDERPDQDNHDDHIETIKTQITHIPNQKQSMESNTSKNNGYQHQLDNSELGSKQKSDSVSHSSRLHHIHNDGTSYRNAVQGSQRQLFHIDKLTIEGDSTIKLGLFILMTIVAFVAYGFETHELDFYQTTSIIMGGIYAQWLISVILALFNSDSICAVRVITSKVPGFGFTAFPTQLFLLEDKPVESISEFAGVRGSTVHISTLTMGVGICTLFIVSLEHIKYEIYVIYDHHTITDLSIQQIIFFLLGFTCAVGFLFLGYFEMNNHSKVHKVMHYGAVPLVAIGIIPFGMITNWNIIFVAIGGTGAGLFVCYVACLLVFGNGRKYPNNPRRVHWVSVALVSLEIGWSGFAGICAVLTVYSLRKVEAL